jgi:hypothetical protein
MKTIEEYKMEYALQDTVTPHNEAERVIFGLIEEFANDRNSSKFREDVTKIVIGLRPSEGKMGYDDDFEAIEVKPVNITGKNKLDGKGSFSDLTWARHKKYVKDNVRMLISGFQHGKLLFIVEFPYKSIRERMEMLLTRKLPNGDVPSTYVRTAAFNYVHWQDKNFKVHFIRPNVKKYQKVFNKKFFKLLMDNE